MDAGSLQSDEEDCDEDDVMFHEIAGKRRGRKMMCCPKTECSTEYKGENKQRLFKHIERDNCFDPKKEDYLREVEKLCPPRNKIPKSECSKCHKLIAGNISQMKTDQAGSGCN